MEIFNDYSQNANQNITKDIPEYGVISLQNNFITTARREISYSPSNSIAPSKNSYDNWPTLLSAQNCFSRCETFNTAGKSLTTCNSPAGGFLSSLITTNHTPSGDILSESSSHTEADSDNETDNLIDRRSFDYKLFIEKVEDYEIIWNPLVEGYKCIDSRNQAWEYVLREMSKQKPAIPNNRYDYFSRYHNFGKSKLRFFKSIVLFMTVNRGEMNHWGELNHDFQVKISPLLFFDKFSFDKQRF